MKAMDRAPFKLLIHCNLAVDSLTETELPTLYVEDNGKSILLYIYYYIGYLLTLYVYISHCLSIIIIYLSYTSLYTTTIHIIPVTTTTTTTNISYLLLLLYDNPTTLLLLLL